MGIIYSSMQYKPSNASSLDNKPYYFASTTCITENMVQRLEELECHQNSNWQNWTISLLSSVSLCCLFSTMKTHDKWSSSYLLGSHRINNGCKLGTLQCRISCIILGANQLGLMRSYTHTKHHLPLRNLKIQSNLAGHFCHFMPNTSIARPYGLFHVIFIEPFIKWMPCLPSFSPQKDQA